MYDEKPSDNPEWAAENSMPIGTPVTNGGVVLTVEKVDVLPELELLYDEVLKPRHHNAKFVVVRTRVRNDSKRTFDLSCSYEVDATLYTRECHKYGHTGDLYDIPGNPECNYELGYGFDHAMTWAFEVPENYELGYFAFFDPNENYGNPSLIDLTRNN
ncbi:hypothetical protein BJP08_02970 [Corynebacterium sp. NML140438]|uniref:hypothetical protein n=1 Tax=Corynebacterium sp. NML140438 TaxID=1906334 RepID=UPI0008FB0AFE|nr:hypothetical protein [Corynebacterium sp. NML140438]OIR42302.1 hypothetical protein BJP08_02970 [Corynebacterium sp. NML140438]